MNELGARGGTLGQFIVGSTGAGMVAHPCHERLREDFGLYPMTNDEAVTCRAILEQEPSASMLLMPTHHISHSGDMMGFKYECSDRCSGGALPVVRNMFFGHTAVECLDDDAAIMRLMSKPEENRLKMAAFMERLRREHRPPELDCIPDNATAISSNAILQATDLRSVDCTPWNPEPPETIGLYHAYIRGYNRDVRTHKLFIVCSGGCPKAADQFCNLMIDVGHKWTAGQVADSEEAWWLKKASQRARCRLIKRLADAFEVRVQCVEDVLAHPLSDTTTWDSKAPGQRGADGSDDERSSADGGCYADDMLDNADEMQCDAEEGGEMDVGGLTDVDAELEMILSSYDDALKSQTPKTKGSPEITAKRPVNPMKPQTAPQPVLLAVPTTDTVEHDIVRKMGSNAVSVYNTAVDTTRVTNGMVCQMHPSEGYWLFRGAPRGTGVHGAMFGSHQVCGAFPTRSPMIVPTAGCKSRGLLTAHDGACVVRGSNGGGEAARKHGQYLCFDESFFKNLERMQWNRDNGYVELIPIVVGVP